MRKNHYHKVYSSDFCCNKAGQHTALKILWLTECKYLFPTDMFVRKFRLSSGLSTASLTGSSCFQTFTWQMSSTKPNPIIWQHETWACIMSTYIPLATGSHRAKLRVTEGRRGSIYSIGRQDEITSKLWVSNPYYQEQ